MIDTIISTDEYDFIHLGWDTELFDVKCAKLILKKQISNSVWEDITMLYRDYEFITIVNENNLNSNNYILGTMSNAFLVDVQIVFSKDVEVKKQDNDVIILDEFPFNEDIIKIASRNFSYSRFFNDPNISSDDANQIYVKWANSSFDKKGNYFAICRSGGKIQGFFLFAFDHSGNLDQGKGFMVVDKEFQGQGVGKKLISSIEAFAHSQGSQLIYGGTQVDNIKMVNHFFSNGYRFVRRNTVYHLWLK